jgi:uncharacterized GH25 family protein
VIDEQGKPIARASLLYRHGSDPKEPHPLKLHTETDAAGRFTFKVPMAWLNRKDLTSVHYVIWTYAPHRRVAATRIYKQLREDKPSKVTVELRRATNTTFVVHDPKGHPVAGADVRADNWSLGGTVPTEITPLLSTRTDEQGRAKLPTVSPDDLYNLDIKTDAYGEQNQRIDWLRRKSGKSNDWIIRLRPTCRIEGRLIAEKPEWVKHVRFFFMTEGRRLGSTTGRALAMTDVQGRFVVPSIPEGRLHVFVAMDESLPVRPKLPGSLELKAGKMTLDIPMVRLVKVEGLVRAKDTGKPIAGAKVQVRGVHEYTSDTAPVSMTDAQGRFSTHVVPGKLRYRVFRVPEEINYVQLNDLPPIEVPEDAGPFELPPIEVVPTKPLRGRLVDRNGNPVADAGIGANHQNNFCSHAESDRDGRFTLSKMPASLDPAKAGYGVELPTGKTRYSCSGDVEVIQTDPLVLRVKR